MQILTLKTKLIFQDERDKKAILQVLESSKLLFNEISPLHFSVNERGYVNCKSGIKNLHDKAYRKIRKKFPEIKSQLVIKAEQAVLSAYRSVKNNKHKIIKPCEKKKLSLVLDKRLYSYRGTTFRITTLKKRVEVSLHIYERLSEFLGKYLFRDPTIVAENNDVWICLPFKVDTPIIEPRLALGIDLGCRRFAATSDGRIFLDKQYKKQLRKIRFLKRRLKAKSSIRKLKKVRRKERNISQDFRYRLVKTLLNTKANVLVVENLNAKGIKTKKYFKDNINYRSQVGFAETLDILAYKAALIGKLVVRVCPKFSSQIDSVTGKREGKRVGCRFYSKSGLIYDADVNASHVLAQRSNLPYLGGNILEGQAIVNTPIAGGTLPASPHALAVGS